jgi:hypothetical protein
MRGGGSESDLHVGQHVIGRLPGTLCQAQVSCVALCHEVQGRANGVKLPCVEFVKRACALQHMQLKLHKRRTELRMAS